MTGAFPETPDFTGFNEPMRLECDIYDLVVEGEIPREIRGSWFRLTPDPQYPPLLGYDTYLSGGGFNRLVRLEPGSGRKTTFTMGEQWSFSEPIHIASEQPGHEGWLALVVDDHDRYLSEVALLEAGHIDRGPIARIKLPIRLRPQVHGNWVDGLT